jgi:hypothetical protein
MNDFEADVKATYEALAGRALADIEVAEIGLALRQLATFLIECGRDEDLMARLGLLPRVAPRAAENTRQNSRSPEGARLSTKTTPPTGASSHDTLPHPDPSASIASASPAGQPATPQPIQRATTGATVDGSL